MITYVYSVFDTAVGAYLPPFFMRSKGEALRAFEQVVNDENSQISRTPAHYTLFELGEFNDNSGALTSHLAPLSLGNGVEFVRSGQAA